MNAQDVEGRKTSPRQAMEQGLKSGQAFQPLTANEVRNLKEIIILKGEQQTNMESAYPSVRMQVETSPRRKDSSDNIKPTKLTEPTTFTKNQSLRNVPKPAAGEQIIPKVVFPSEDTYLASVDPLDEMCSPTLLSDVGNNLFISYFLHALEIERLLFINQRLVTEAITMENDIDADQKRIVQLGVKNKELMLEIAELKNQSVNFESTPSAATSKRNGYMEYAISKEVDVTTSELSKSEISTLKAKIGSLEDTIKILLEEKEEREQEVVAILKSREEEIQTLSLLLQQKQEPLSAKIMTVSNSNSASDLTNTHLKNLEYVPKVDSKHGQNLSPKNNNVESEEVCKIEQPLKKSQLLEQMVTNIVKESDSIARESSSLEALFTSNNNPVNYSSKLQKTDNCFLYRPTKTTKQRNPQVLNDYPLERVNFSSNVVSTHKDSFYRQQGEMKFAQDVKVLINKARSIAKPSTLNYNLHGSSTYVSHNTHMTPIQKYMDLRYRHPSISRNESSLISKTQLQQNLSLTEATNSFSESRPLSSAHKLISETSKNYMESFDKFRAQDSLLLNSKKRGEIKIPTDSSKPPDYKSWKAERGLQLTDAHHGSTLNVLHNLISPIVYSRQTTPIIPSFAKNISAGVSRESSESKYRHGSSSNVRDASSSKNLGHSGRKQKPLYLTPSEWRPSGGH
jgi:hypothetical protein